jgi:cation transport ATPase
LDFHSESDQREENVYDEEYKERSYTTRQEAKRELAERGYKQSFLGRKKKNSDEEGEAGVNSPSRSRSPKKIKKVEMFWVKLVFKILVVGAVCYNFKFILNFMKEPISNFTHTLFVVGTCVGINFIAVWILFYKRSFMRFYLSLFAILGSFGYYFYVNYTNHSFLGNNIITSLLVIISVLMVINPKVNYYVKSILLLLIPILGIYFSGNQFALVWTLMFNAGLILFFRMSKLNKSKTNKKEARIRRNKKQSA